MTPQGADNNQPVEPLEQELDELFHDQAPITGPASFLIVAPHDVKLKREIDQLAGDRHCCTWVRTLAEARRLLDQERFDVVIVARELPDGSGMDLTPALHRRAPSTKVILLVEEKSFDAAIRAVRDGAVDVLHVPDDLDEFQDRVARALKSSRFDRQRQQRADRLKSVCAKLAEARNQISRQVDVLCQDLVHAYEELVEQTSEIAMATEYRTLLRQELDIEDLLRTSLEYMLTKTGPTNAAVFLPGVAGEYSLGAYVNYDSPRETIAMLLDHLCSAICPQMANETEIVSFDDAADFAEWIGFDAGLLAESQVVALSCMHGGECLAVIVLFRHEKDPFQPELVGTLDTLRAIFAEQLSHVVKIHHRSKPEWPADAHDSSNDDDYEFNDDSDFGLAA